MNESGQDTTIPSDEILRMTADIVASFVSNNPVTSENVPELIRNVHRAVLGIATESVDRPVEKPKPAISVQKSYTDDYIICLEDGKRLKMLKRYLKSKYKMSPEDYRRRWNLPADYPMVAPAYARRRSDFAKSIGLGRGVRRK